MLTDLRSLSGGAAGSLTRVPDAYDGLRYIDADDGTTTTWLPVPSENRLNTLYDKRAPMTPYDPQFAGGAVGDGVTDDTAALQAWVTYVLANPTRHYALVGKFKTTQPLKFIAAPFTNGLSIHFGARIFSAIAESVPVVEFENVPQLRLNGSLRIAGNGGTFSTRKNSYGITFKTAELITCGQIEVTDMQSGGVLINDGCTQYTFESLSVARNGASPVAPSLAWPATTLSAIAARSGTANSNSQSQTVTLTAPLPSFVAINDWFLRIGGASGRLHRIVGVTDTSNVSVFPWLDPAVTTGAQVDLIGGAGFKTVGSDSSCGIIHQFNAKSNGAGSLLYSLYPPSFTNYVSQANAISGVLGTNMGAGLVSLDIKYLYRESELYGFVKGTAYNTQIRIGASVDVNPQQWLALAPTDNAGVPYFTTFSGLTSYTDSGPMTPSGLQSGGAEFGSYTVNTVIGHYEINANTLTLNIASPHLYAANQLTGRRSITVTVLGTGSNNQPTGTVTVNPPTGFTLNGGAAGVGVTFSGAAKALVLVMIYTGGTAWKVVNVADVSASALPGYAAAVAGQVYTRTPTGSAWIAPNGLFKVDGTGPSVLTDVALWLKADALSLADGTAVSSWTDSSGNARHAVQATAGSQPIYKTGILNGKPVLRFDGAASTLQIPAFAPGTNAVSILIVMASGSAQAGTGIIVESSANPNTNAGAFTAYRAANNVTVGANSGAAVNGVTTNAVSPLLIAATLDFTRGLRFTQTTINGVYNDTNINANQNAAATFTSQAVNIGARAGTSLFFAGDIAEIIVFKRLLTPLELADAQTAYLKGKYGFTF